MKKKILTSIIFVMTIVLFPVEVFADCQSDFSAYESGFKATFDYVEETDDFTITLVNPNFELYSLSYDNIDMQKAEENITKISGNIKELTVVIRNYKESEYAYKLIALYNGCQNVTVKEGTLKLTKYNPYADDPACTGNEDFVLCQKDYDKKIDETEFKERLETYVESKQETETPTIGETKKNTKKTESQSVFEDIISFFQEYPIMIVVLIAVIIAIIVGIVVLVKRAIKRRRLD